MRHGKLLHLRLLQDCAEVCDLTRDMLLRSSDLAHQACRLAADVNDRCATSCDQLGGEQMQRCARELSSLSRHLCEYCRLTMTRTILCFGDSNTWGYSPETGERFAPDVRWPGVLAARLGGRARVIEEGLNGRTSAYDGPLDPILNGKTFLPVCLATHAPIEWW